MGVQKLLRSFGPSEHDAGNHLDVSTCFAQEFLPARKRSKKMHTLCTRKKGYFGGNQPIQCFQTDKYSQRKSIHASLDTAYEHGRLIETFSNICAKTHGVCTQPKFCSAQIGAASAMKNQGVRT